MIRRSPLAVLIMLAGVGACDSGADSDVVARASRNELTIDQAARLLASQSQLPNVPEVVEAVADLWIDYTLLAQAALEDSLLETVDLSPLVRQEIEQEMVYRLRDQVIQVDTVVTDEELVRLWDASEPGGQIRASHILLGLPNGATDAQRDSVHAFAAGLKERIEAGEDFAALAARYSQDGGTAQNGGSLGSLERGGLVAAFEEVAFALEPGEISDPVETVYGVHVIRLDQKELETLEGETRTMFLGEVRASRLAVAESLYVAGIEEPADVRVSDGAYAVVREISRRPGQKLGRRAASRPISTFGGGRLTAGDFQDWVQSRPPAFRTQLSQADSVSLEGLIRQLARGELLVMEASAQGFDPEPAQVDSLMERARSNFVIAANQLGLLGIEVTEGQSAEEAIEERVTRNLTEILQGQRDVIPLGVIAYALRQQYDAELLLPAIPRVVDAVDNLGSGQAPTPAGPAPRAPNAPPPVADSTGE